MNGDAEKRILAAIEDLREDVKNVREDVKNVREGNTNSHKDIVSMIGAVQKTQKDHTDSLKLISIFTAGELPRVIDEIAKAVGIQKTGLTDKIIELSRKAEAAKL